MRLFAWCFPTRIRLQASTLFKTLRQPQQHDALPRDGRAVVLPLWPLLARCVLLRVAVCVYARTCE
jgi:hypothetical protein